MTDPGSVDSSWSAYFDGIDVADVVRATAGALSVQGIDVHRTAIMLGRLVENYRWRGHLRARLDPLGLAAPPGDRELSLDALGVSLGDPGVARALDGKFGLAGAPLRVIVSRLEHLYCGTIGFEARRARKGSCRPESPLTPLSP